MPKLSSVAAGQPSTVKVEFGGEVFSVTYDTIRYTGEFEAQVAEQASDPYRQIGTAAIFVAGLVTEWDVLQEDGTPYPITPEAIASFPGEFTGLIVNAIVQDARPGEASGSFAGG